MVSETRLQEIARLQAEIAERQARLKHLVWAAERAGEIRISGVVVEQVAGAASG